jgi:hypothetical protein
MIPVKIKNKETGQDYALHTEVIKIGRALDNDIILEDLSVSRYHLFLQSLGDSVVIQNTGSDGGFYVNKQWHLDKAYAKSGDIIQVGNVRLEVDLNDIKAAEGFGFIYAESFNKPATLNIDSKNKKIRVIALALIGAMFVGIHLMPEESDKAQNRTPAQEEQNLAAGPLPNESYLENLPIRLGQQEITAEDYYNQGLREYDNKNYLRAIQYFQQSLVEDPSLNKSRGLLQDSENFLKRKTQELVLNSEKNFKDGRLRLSRSQANQALDLLSEQIPGFGFQTQKRQRTLATQRMPILSREEIYITLDCGQTPDENLCSRASEILKQSRIKLGEENKLK